MPTKMRSLMLLALALAMLSASGAIAQQQASEAPFGDRVSERVPYYHRTAPTVATAGPLGRLGIIEAKAVGFRSILNLGSSTSSAGLNDREMAVYANLEYFNVPLSDPPTDQEVDQVSRILNAKDNGPILIYGSGRDQAAAVWTLVRAAAGVRAELALQEGPAAGLSRRAAMIRERLGLRGEALR